LDRDAKKTKAAIIVNRKLSQIGNEPTNRTSIAAPVTISIKALHASSAGLRHSMLSDRPIAPDGAASVGMPPGAIIGNDPFCLSLIVSLLLR
jgi:hypothetical protein